MTKQFIISENMYNEHVTNLIKAKGSIEKAMADAAALVKLYDRLGTRTAIYYIDKFFSETSTVYVTESLTF